MRTERNQIESDEEGLNRLGERLDLIRHLEAKYDCDEAGLLSLLAEKEARAAEIESLIQEKNSGYNDYRAKREEYRRLQTVKGNIDQILRRERKPVKRQEQER